MNLNLIKHKEFKARIILIINVIKFNFQERMLKFEVIMHVMHVTRKVFLLLKISFFIKLIL